MTDGGPKGHKGFIGGLLYCPVVDKRVEMKSGRYAGFFHCPGCNQRIEGVRWR